MLLLQPRGARRFVPLRRFRHDVARECVGTAGEALEALAGVHGTSLQWLPQLILIRLQPQHGDPLWLTLVNNSAHKNVAEIFFESQRRLPVGASPREVARQTMQVRLLPAFLGGAGGLHGFADVALCDIELTDRDFGVRQAGEKNFTKDTRSFALEVYREENLGLTIYICETGAMSAVAKQ